MREGGADGYSGRLWAPTYRRFQIRPGVRKNYLLHGTRFFEHADGRRRVALFEVDDRSKPKSVEFALLGTRREWAEIDGELRALHRGIRRNHYLCGQAIDAAGRVLSGNQSVTWDDLVLEPGLAEALQRQVVDFLRLGESFRRNGVPHRRGVLLYGPPGNGKTTIGRVLAGLGRTTFVYVTAADVAGNPLHLRRIFHLARRLRPTVLFLEDLDFYASERGRSDGAALGELLAQMDGLERNDGLIVIATTNDLAAIEPALRDRPSRFDVALEVSAPAAEGRRRLLSRFLRNVAIRETDLAAASEASEGLSGAQIRELSIVVIQQAVIRGAFDDAGRARPTLVDVESAVSQVLGRRKTSPLGFHAKA